MGRADAAHPAETGPVADRRPGSAEVVGGTPAMSSKNLGNPKAGCATLFAGLLVVFGIIFVFNGIRSIPLNGVGVIFNAQTGRVTHVMNSKMVWVWPWFEKLITYPTGIRNASYVMASHEGERQGDDSIHASTAEGASLPVDVTVAYHVEPTEAAVQKVLDSFGTVDL